MDLKELTEAAKTIGFPVLVAIYFMVKDWKFTSQITRALVRVAEILGIEKGHQADKEG